MVYHLLAERSRRKTLVAVFHTAPVDSIVMQGRGPGCPELWVRVGTDSGSGESPVGRREDCRRDEHPGGVG